MEEAVFMEALAHYRLPETFQAAQSQRVPCLFRVRQSLWAVEFRMLAAAVILRRTAADMQGHMPRPDTTTSVYRTRVSQWVATVPPAHQRQER